MSEFAPGETKTAIAPMFNPTGKPFDYLAQLYMGTDLAVMSEAPFHLEAGETKDISLPVIMPSLAGTYPVYLGVFSNGVNIALYQAEDITIITPILAGVILDTKWRETGTEEWLSPPVSLPAYAGFDCKWRVRNNSNCRATFTTGIMGLGYYRAYGQTVTTLDPGEEADLIFIGFSGFSAGTSGSEIIYLGVLPGTVIETGQQYWIEAELVDSVTIYYSWY